MRDYMEFIKHKYFRDNADFNSFCVGNCIGAFAITLIVCFSLFCVMVFGADGHLYFPNDATPWYIDTDGNTAFGNVRPIFIKRSDGLCDVISAGSELNFYGFMTSAGAPNTSGARSGVSFTPDFADDNTSYWVINSFCWYSSIDDSDSLIFDESHRNDAYHALTDSSYSRYAMNWDDMPLYSNDYSNFFKVYFSAADAQSATLTIEPTDEYLNSEHNGETIQLKIEPMSYCGYFHNTLGKKLDPNRIYDYNLPLSADCDINILADRWASSTDQRDFVYNSELSASYFDRTDNQIYGKDATACLVLQSSVGDQPITVSFSGQTINQQITFNQSCYDYSHKYIIGGVNTNNYSCTPCAYRAVVTPLLNSGDGPSAQGGYVYGAPLGTYKWFDTSFFKGSPVTSKTEYSSVDPGTGNISSDRLEQYNDNGLVTSNGFNLNNNNVVDYINNGLGFTGNNGFLVVMERTIGFLPTEVWTLIYTALALSLTIMIIKVLRGM